MCLCVYVHLVCNVKQCRWGSGPEIEDSPESRVFCTFGENKVCFRIYVTLVLKNGRFNNLIDADKYLPIIGVNLAPG